MNGTSKIKNIITFAAQQEETRFHWIKVDDENLEEEREAITNLAANFENAVVGQLEDFDDGWRMTCNVPEKLSEKFRSALKQTGRSTEKHFLDRERPGLTTLFSISLHADNSREKIDEILHLGTTFDGCTINLSKDESSITCCIPTEFNGQFIEEVQKILTNDNI